MEQHSLTKEEIQRFREISIHDILGVQNNGRRIDMSCPFPGHDDRDPSFSLYPDNSFTCYGMCNVTGGNAIDFMKMFTGKEKFVDNIVDLLPYL